MGKIFIEFLSYNLIGLFLVLFIGKLVTSCLSVKANSSKFFDIFIQFSIGLLVIVLFSSLILTKGATIFLLIMSTEQLSYVLKSVGPSFEHA